MWEQIRANRRRSIILISLMGTLMMLMGCAIGLLIAGPRGWPIGLAIGFVIWGVQMIIYYTSAESILMSGMTAQQIRKEDSPRLWNIVEEMTIASGLPVMPRVFIVDEPSPNAFAMGRKPEESLVAVTSGLLNRLNRDELQGVVAHEIGHIKNRDVQFMTLAGIMLGTIVMLAEFVRSYLWFGGGRMRSRSDSRDNDGGGQAQLIALVVGILVALLAPIMAQMLYFACSRKREYLADASAAVFTRYPEGLASALEKITNSHTEIPNVSKAVAPMYIVNPMYAAGSEPEGFFSTHPPASTRVKILRSMGGAGLMDYENAFEKTTGKRAMGSQTLASEAASGSVAAAGGGAAVGGAMVAGMAAMGAVSGAVPVRAASTEADEPVEKKQETRAVLNRLSGFIAVQCACGMKMNVPPNFEGESVACIRCGAQIALPAVKERYPTYLDKANQPKPGSMADAPPLHYKRQNSGWDSFRCECGTTVQLSPTFNAPRTKCPKCGRGIEVEPA